MGVGILGTPCHTPNLTCLFLCFMELWSLVMTYEQGMKKKFLISGVQFDEFKGNKMIKIPFGKPEPDGRQEAFSFGLAKARAIVKYYDAIKSFVDENSQQRV